MCLVQFRREPKSDRSSEEHALLSYEDVPINKAYGNATEESGLAKKNCNSAKQSMEILEILHTRTPTFTSNIGVHAPYF